MSIAFAVLAKYQNEILKEIEMHIKGNQDITDIDLARVLIRMLHKKDSIFLATQE